MSIPKEPRQLMINIMYLVLTAMLALNVSAEIFNAFKLVDKSLQKSNDVLDQANANIPAEVARLAKKDMKRLGTYAERTGPVMELSKTFSDTIDSFILRLSDSNRDGIIDDEDYVMKADKETGEMVRKDLKNKKNFDITTRLMIGKDITGETGPAADLKKMIEDYQTKFMSFIDKEDQPAYASKISMKIDDAWESSDKPSWAQFNFGHMPVQAVLPMLTKMKNDAKSSETAVLNYLMGKVGGEDIVFNKFRVVSAPKKSYVIKGEKFETELFLSASSDKIKGMSVNVDGRSIPVKDGVATYTQTAGQTGVKKYDVNISITNPVTGEVTREKGTFEYEVGERSCNVAATKMNVFYIGVENPVSVTAAGISSNDLNVKASGVNLKKSGGGYVVTASKPGAVDITVSGGGLKATKFPFRVKRIPDPVARLSKSAGGAMGNGEFKAQGGVGAFLDNFDFDAKCKIQGYILTKLAPRQDPIESNNAGARYNEKSGRLVKSAKPGDTYYFDNVKAKCPGDSAGRKINSMVFKIK